MNCNICQNGMQEIFKATVLKKHLTHYYQCTSCGFIQTDSPHWLEEAYESAITAPDVGLVYRNLSLSKKTEEIVVNYFNYNEKFLDYAGGYGLFVRLMRDKGFDFYRQDPYCENIFARNLDVVDLAENTKFELATAFEVFEHWTDPLSELEKVLVYSDSILFSTELQPDKKFNSSDDWWYFIPETGQHVAFYTINSLKFIADKYKLNFYSNNRNLHILTKKILKENPFIHELNGQKKKKSFFEKVLRKMLRSYEHYRIGAPDKKYESLLTKDFNDAKDRISVKK